MELSNLRDLNFIVKAFNIQSVSPRTIALHFSERGVIEQGYGKGVLEVICI